MITFPNARITLGLWITGRRPDGFHDIETLMVPVPMYDALEAVPSPNGETRLSLSGLPIPGDGRPNLCLRAYQLMQEVLTPGKDTATPPLSRGAPPPHSSLRHQGSSLSQGSMQSQRSPLPPLHIHLHKGIPAGAGLAGGSADAAFMLRMLNAYADPPLTTDELASLAAQLGSDCPFFINNEAALATGRGNILKHRAVPDDFNNHRLEIITPNIHISTAEAYRRIQPKKRHTSLATLLQQPISKWKHLIINDFEETVFEMHPEIADIKARLYDQGAVYASLSGSGSAVYALF